MRALSWLGTVRRNRRAGDRRPRLLTHTVTFRCDARCEMCDSWRIRSADDLELHESERIYRELPRLDAVRLTGGEPFVRKDFPEIARLAQALLQPFGLHITTNGFQTDRIVRYCEERERDRPLHLLVSLDGVGEVHDRIRGRERAWERAFGTVAALAPRQKELRLRIGVNQTLLDGEGVENYRELREALRPLGIVPQVVVAYESSATYSLQRDLDLASAAQGEYSTHGRFERRDLEALFALLEEDLARLGFAERFAKRYYLEGLRARLLGEGDRLNPPCVALHNHLRIFPNGDVPTCQFNSRTVGNLREQSFAELWTSGETEARRRWVRACKGCWAECEILPSAIYSGDLLAPRREGWERPAAVRTARALEGSC